MAQAQWFRHLYDRLCQIAEEMSENAHVASWTDPSSLNHLLFFHSFSGRAFKVSPTEDSELYQAALPSNATVAVMLDENAGQIHVRARATYTPENMPYELPGFTMDLQTPPEQVYRALLDVVERTRQATVRALYQMDQVQERVETLNLRRDPNLWN